MPALIDILPSELLSLVFLVVQAMENAENGERQEDGLDAWSPPLEMRVSHVGALWREIALGTGQLWSNIVVEPGYAPQAVQAYITRSRQCPLDIELYNCPDTLVTSEILDVIFQQSIRWRTCNLEGGMDDSIMSRIVSIAAPILKWLQFAIQSPTRARHANETWQGRRVLVGGCSMLKVARLHGFALHFSRPVFLSGLTCLKLDCTGNLPLRYIDLKALLTECYSLEYFSIRGEIVDAPPWPDYAPILLPKLLSLHVFSLYGQVYSGVLLIVDSPLLQSLDLEDAHDSDLDTFFRTPHELPSLRSFSLSGTSYFTPSKLNRVYALFPSLNEISLPDFVFNPPAILKAVSESMQDLRPYATSQRTLGLMLNPTQRSSLKHMLEGRLENDADILELFGYGWTFTNFFDWLQNFVTDEIL